MEPAVAGVGVAEAVGAWGTKAGAAEEATARA